MYDRTELVMLPDDVHVKHIKRVAILVFLYTTSPLEFTTLIFDLQTTGQTISYNKRSSSIIAFSLFPLFM